jgi:hypothetical protein
MPQRLSYAPSPFELRPPYDIYNHDEFPPLTQGARTRAPTQTPDLTRPTPRITFPPASPYPESLNPNSP